MRFLPAVAVLTLIAGGEAFGADLDPNHRHHVIAPDARVPTDSIYQLPMRLTTQDGRDVPLDALRGRPVLVTMFYASCDGVCPLLAFTLRRMVAGLPEAQRERLQVLMVSFDPERDSPQALRAFAKLHHIDQAQWLLGRAAEGDVRAFAAVLGIRYRQLPSGVFSHSALITLLDAEGVIRARTTMLNDLDPEFMRSVGGLLQ